MEFLNRAASHPATSAWFCLLLQALRRVNPLEACATLLFPEVGLTGTLRVFPADDACPAFGAVIVDNRTIVWIDGATRLAQMQGLIEGYTGNLQAGSSDPTNTYLDAAAAALLNKLAASGISTTQVWTIAGYSLGGAIAPLLRVNQAIKPWYEASVEVISFGAPRSGGESTQRFITANCNLTRWMTAADPVPLVPPRTDDIPFLPGIIGIRPALRWSNFVHCRGGREVDNWGHITERILPSAASLDVAMSLATWLFTYISAAENDHSLQVYRERLLLANNSSTVALHSTGAAAEPRQNLPRPQMIAAERATEQRLVAIERQQNEVPLDIPKVDRLSVTNVGRMFYLLFRNEVICASKSKRKLRAIKNEMNKALARLQTVGVVDTAALGSEFTRYLDDASDPQGEFSPVMRTNWNLNVL